MRRVRAVAISTAITALFTFAIASLSVLAPPFARFRTPTPDSRLVRGTPQGNDSGRAARGRAPTTATALQHNDVTSPPPQHLQ